MSRAKETNVTRSPYHEEHEGHEAEIKLEFMINGIVQQPMQGLKSFVVCSVTLRVLHELHGGTDYMKYSNRTIPWKNLK